MDAVWRCRADVGKQKWWRSRSHKRSMRVYEANLRLIGTIEKFEYAKVKSCRSFSTDPISGHLFCYLHRNERHQPRGSAETKRLFREQTVERSYIHPQSGQVQRGNGEQ